ncbi:MAG: multicopper oxidase domain-containing protein, partial [Clostridia bacterium]|nr:multicopper oxidase domain-containing protein [Clostridia bacterium]
LRVKNGESDVAHAFAIPQLGVRAEVPAGGQAVVRFTPRRPGVYAYRCEAACGPGCEAMRGVLNVR